MSFGKYESSFENCFGVSAKGRVGKICGGCRYAVTLYRKSQAFGSTDIKTFFHKADSRENKTIPKSVLLRQEQAQYLKDCWDKTKHRESPPVPACELAIFQLPPEVIVNILVHSRNPIDAINFGQICRAANEIVSSNDQ